MEKMNEAKASQIKKILADKDVIDAVMPVLERLYDGFVPFGLTDATKAKLMAAVFDPTKDVAFDTCDTEDLDKLKAKYAKKGYKVLYEIDNMDSAALAFIKNTALKESSDGRLPEGIAARSWQYDKDERVAKAFFKAQDADDGTDFTEFVKKFSADYGISLFSLRSALNKCFECPSSEFYEYDHCAFCASCVDEMIRKTSAVREGTLAKGRQRIREGIISSKDGDKTFDQLYGDGGVQLDEADEEWAQAFARCFESTKASSPNRLRESEDKDGYSVLFKTGEFPDDEYVIKARDGKVYLFLSVASSDDYDSSEATMLKKNENDPWADSIDDHIADSGYQVNRSSREHKVSDFRDFGEVVLVLQKARRSESTAPKGAGRIRESYGESQVATQDYARCEERIIDIVGDLTENPRNPAKASSKKYADNEVGQGWTIREIWQDITGAGNWLGFIGYLKAKNSELLDFIREEDLV